MINKVDEGVLIDLCEQFNKVILEVLGFYGEFRYREGESDDYYIISNKIKASKEKRFDLNMSLYKNKEKNEFLYVYILWFSVNPKKVGLGSIIINEIIEVLKACTNLEFLVLHPDDNEVKYFWMKNNFMISDGKIENRININTRRILIYNVY